MWSVNDQLQQPYSKTPPPPDPNADQTGAGQWWPNPTMGVQPYTAPAPPPPGYTGSTATMSPTAATSAGDPMLQSLMAQLAPASSPMTQTDTGAADTSALSFQNVPGQTWPGGTDMFRDRLLELMGTDPYNVSITDRQIQPAAQAYRQAVERAQAQRRNAAAERLNAQGLATSGALDSEVAQGYSDAGQAIGTFNANLVMQEMSQRRDLLMQALQLGAGYLTEEQSTQLRRELAYLDANLRREDLGARLGMFEAGLNQNSILALLGAR